MEPSAFRWFAEGKVLTESSVAFGLHFQFANKPLEVIAPSADPSGRPITVVSKSHRLELRAATGLGQGLDVSVALPLGLYQSGTGSEALSTQSPAPIGQSGFGDLRVGFRTRLPKPIDALDWTLRLETSLPTGNEKAYLGEPSFTETLATNLALSLGPILVVADFGAKVTKPRTFADVGIGPQLLCGLGVAYRILPEQMLTVGVEGLLRPMLNSSPEMTSTNDETTTTHATRVIPAEWLISASTRPAKAPIWFSLGAGTALALSSRENEGVEKARVAENFIAPTSPRFKLTSSVTVLY